MQQVSDSIVSSFPLLPENQVKSIRIEILEVSGGGGHKTAADAVQIALKVHYETLGFNVKFKRKDVSERLTPDIVSFFTRGVYKNLDFHNYLAKNGHGRLLNIFVKIGKIFNSIYSPKTVGYFNHRYDKLATRSKLPDLVISVSPVINASLVRSLKSKNIPVMVIATDADSSYFSMGFSKDQQATPYRYCVAYNSWEILKRVDKEVNLQYVRAVGYPTRPEFLKEYSAEEKEKFKDNLAIPRDKKHVGVMMGSLGGIALKRYFQEILRRKDRSKFTDDTHFSFFCGTNEELKTLLIRQARKQGFSIDRSSNDHCSILKDRSGFSFSIVGYTEEVYKYMAISDCWITKTGSGSFNECLAMGVPMLLDHTSSAVDWENLNFTIAETYRLGKEVKNFKEINSSINIMLNSEENRKYCHSIKKYCSKRSSQKNFANNIVQLTDELLREASQRETTNTPNKTTTKHWYTVAKKVITIFIKIVLFVPLHVLNQLDHLLKEWIDDVFFKQFATDENVREKRRANLIRGIRTNRLGKYTVKHTAIPIEGKSVPLYSNITNKGIDSLYLKSKAANRTGNVIVFALAKDYQYFNPKNFDHLLEDGADVVLFNPTARNSITMASDLKTVIAELYRNNPNRKMCLHGCSIGAHVAAFVAADIASGGAKGMPALSIPLILDRGFGNSHEIVQKKNPIARIPYIKNYIKSVHNVDSLTKMVHHTAGMLLFSPKEGHDQLCHKTFWGSRRVVNYTRELANTHQNGMTKYVELKGGDHWTSWTYKAQNQAKEFLKEHNIIQEGYRKFSETDTGGFPSQVKAPWGRVHLLPLII